MNKITWYNYDDTDADSFRVYRSVPGFLIPFASLSASPEFRFSATSPDIQAIVINTTNIDAAVASLDGARGIEAKKNTAGTHIIVRLLARNGRLKLYKSTLLEDLGMEPQIIVPGLSFAQISGSIPFVVGEDPYEYQDDDGSYLDSYYVTSVKSSVESLPSFIQEPQVPGVNLCMVEARFVDIQGRPVRGIEVTAEAAVLDDSGLTSNKIKVISDAYGRIALPLLQCHQYVLHAPAIGYNQFIEVPELQFLDLTKYPASTRPEFSPFGDVP